LYAICRIYFRSLAGTGYGAYRGYKGELEKADRAIRLHGKKKKNR
jgi:hypothetical protein